MTVVKLTLALSLLALLACGCSEQKKPSDEAKADRPKTAQQSFHAPTLAAFTQAGLKVDPFEQTAARPYQAQECVRGEVQRLDVLLCRFDGDDDARAKQQQLEQFVSGAVSGAVRAAGPLALAVADRKKADLAGKGINTLLKAFAGDATAKAGK